MRTLLNVIAGLFLIGWVLGLFLFKDRILVHILLVLAVFAAAINLLIIEESTEKHHKIERYGKRKSSQERL